MKNILFPCCLLLLAVLLTGCPKPAPKHPVFEAGKPFTMAQSQTFQTMDNALTITFDKVSGDSRCPEGVQCIWAGRVDAVFTLTKGETTETITLANGDFGQGGSDHATFGGYTVTLNSMAPPKKAGSEIEQKDYLANLTVTQ